MSSLSKGELVPVGGGDAIPLLRDVLSVGRRENCDIRLDFPNVSGMHCELLFQSGHWIVRDAGSTNGIKVNGLRVHKKTLMPDDIITIARRSYTIKYTPMTEQSKQELMEDFEEIMDQPLLEKAGLSRPPRHGRHAKNALDEEDGE